MTRRGRAVLVSIALGASLLIGAGATAQAAEGDPVVNDCLVVDGDLWDSMAPFEIVHCAEAHNSEVIRVMEYPDDAGAPSTIADRVSEYVGDQCTFDVARTWLGAGSIDLPLSFRWWVRLPTNEQ
jgi:hypothetical protein